MSFSKLHYLVPTLTGLTEFYRDVLGMQELTIPNGAVYAMGENTCRLNFHTAKVAPYYPKPEDLYWKIGLTVGNLDHVVKWLNECNWPVSEPRQFRDIGYMCHISDPNGFTIELLQQGFEGNERPAGVGHPIAGQATLAHITLRVTDIEAAKSYCETKLGLNLLSIQLVSDLGFSLYFYGFETETPPNADLKSVENREWLWRRPYTILELQHLEQTNSVVRKPEAGNPGLNGISIKRPNDKEKFLSLDTLEFGTLTS
jgi:catechol 2,3-dioxygenase-like lactoylglutathione lyase family enzyme